MVKWERDQETEEERDKGDIKRIKMSYVLVSAPHDERNYYVL